MTSPPAESNDRLARTPQTFSRPRRGLLRSFVAIVGFGAVVLAAAGVTAHFIGPVSAVVTVLASFTPLFVILAIAVAMIMAVTRTWVVAVAAVVVAAVGIGAELPLYVGDPPVVDAGTPVIRLMQANLFFCEADAGAVVERVRSHDVDVLTVAELTDAAVGRLAAAGLDELLPYSYLRPAQGGAGGGGIYSRFPLTDTAELAGLEHASVRATIAPPGATPVAVYALHPMPPFPVPTWWWAHELEQIAAALADERLPVIAGGDMNSTWDHKRYRDLLHAGGRHGIPFVDASEFLGSGIVPTYPANTWYPPLVAIDRVLTRGATPLSFERVDLPGSDHDGVISDIALPGPGDPV